MPLSFSVSILSSNSVAKCWKLKPVFLSLDCSDFSSRNLLLSPKMIESSCSLLKGKGGEKVRCLDGCVGVSMMC